MSSPLTISSLSTELLLRVFLHVHDRTRAHQKLWCPPFSQVCGAWRQTAFLAQELWSVIVIWCRKRDPNDRRLSLAELFVERSGNRPLTIVVHSEAAHPRLIALISDNANRVQSLRLHTNSFCILTALCGKPFPSLEACSILLPNPIWPTRLTLAFPNRLCTVLHEIALSGGIRPANFDLHWDKIRHLDANFGLTNAMGDPLANTIPVPLFEVLPMLETLTAALVQSSYECRRFQSPFRWQMTSTVSQHDLVAFRLRCNSAQLQWIPELPRLQRLQLDLVNSWQHGVTYDPGTMLSFFRRAGGQLEFFDFCADVEILDQHPNIWEHLLPLVPKVRALRTLAKQDDRLHILLNHRLTTTPRLLPYLHTLRLRFPWQSDHSLSWTLDALLAMLRSRGWMEEDDDDKPLAQTPYLQAVFINTFQLKTKLGARGLEQLQDSQARLRARYGGRLVLQVNDGFDWSDIEVIGGSLYDTFG